MIYKTAKLAIGAYIAYELRRIRKSDKTGLWVPGESTEQRIKPWLDVTKKFWNDPAMSNIRREFLNG